MSSKKKQKRDFSAKRKRYERVVLVSDVRKAKNPRPKKVALGQHAFENILSNMCDRINVTRAVQDRAKALYNMVRGGGDCDVGGTNQFKELRESKVVKNLSDAGVLGACLVMACRQEGAHRTFNEIKAVSTVSKKEIGHCFLVIKDTFNVQVGTVTTDAFVNRFCGALELSKEVAKAAVRIAKKTFIQDLVSGSPVMVAAAAIYMASRASNEKRSLARIAGVATVNESGIRRAYQGMLPWAATLFPQDFQFKTPIEELSQVGKLPVLCTGSSQQQTDMQSGKSI